MEKLDDEFFRRLQAAAAAPLGPPRLVNGELLPESKQAPAMKKPTIATQAVELARLSAEFFHDGEKEPYAELFCDDHLEIWPIRSKTFKHWLSGLFFRQTGRAIGGQSMADALAVLSSMAVFQGAEKKVCVRIAEYRGDIILDLCMPQWQVVRISKTGWNLTNVSPVAFRRSKGMGALPPPVSGGSLEPLRALLGFSDDDEWVLLVSFLLAALRPVGPYPLLVLAGEQGSGKSVLARTIKSLIDPGKAANRSAPNNNRDLMVSAMNSFVLSFDNLSHIPSELSDSFCRLSTGGGFSTRELYSNDEERIFEASRPVILNSIADVISRADLADRALLLNLPTISGEQRLTENVLTQRLDEMLPGVLGCLLDAVSHGLRTIDTIKLPSLPRMADFAMWAVACTSAFGWPPARFLNAYASNRSAAVELGLAASPLVEPLRLLVAGGTWEGTASDLLQRLSDIVSDSVRRSKQWPTVPTALSNQLRRLTPALRETGLTMCWRKRSPQGRFVRLEQRGDSPSPSSSSSPAAPGDAQVTVGDDQ